MVVSLLLVAATMPSLPTQRSAILLVRLQVVESCTIGRAGANCPSARVRPPVVTRTPDGTLVYTF
jgi:hypothetical protein